MLQVTIELTLALLDDPIQALVLAPLFVVIEMLFALGLYPDLRKRLDSKIRVKVEAYRASK